MKKILFFLIILSNLNSQNLSELTEQNLFRGGNVFLLDKLNKYDLDIEGSPYLNLDFEESCMNFYKSSRPVKTASSEQVRQPIYKSGIDYWKNFKDDLSVLIKHFPDYEK